MHSRSSALPIRTSRRARVMPLALCAIAACGGSSANPGEGARQGTPGAQRSEVAQPPTCRATPTSLTPGGWDAPLPVAPADAPRGALGVVADVPLPGPANRFDYQSVDPNGGRLYVSHMDAGTVVVFDLDSSRVVAEVSGTPRATGIRAVPVHHAVYVAAAGRHEVAVIDERTLAVTAHVGDIRFPDGIAYAPAEDKVFVSDEAGGRTS